MRRRNNRTKPAETVKKTDSKSGFTFRDPSISRPHTDLKRRRNVTFVDVEHRSPLNDSTEARSDRSAALDAKTSEFAAFKKLRSGFGLSSESFSDSKTSNKAEHKPKIFESISRREGKYPQEFAGIDRESKDRCNGYSFSTPIPTTRRGSCGLFKSPVNLAQKDKEKSSSGFRRDKDTIQSGIIDEKDDIFSVKRKKLNQWVKETLCTETHELKLNGHDLVSVLLSRLFPGTEETYPSRLPKEMTDTVKRETFRDSPGSMFHKQSHENYAEIDHRLQMEKGRSVSWQGWLENSITPPSLQFQTGHAHGGFIPRDAEEISFPISYPKRSVYRPPLLNQKASVSFLVDETVDYSPLPSSHFRNYKPLSLGYHREDDCGYISEDLSHDHRPPPSPLLLEWNTESTSTRETEDLPLSYHTELITYPNASSSSLTDNPWSSDYSSSHDLVTRELFPLPLLTHYTSDSFFIPTPNQTSRFEHELESHVVAANQNLLTFHPRDNSDCLRKDYTYSPVDHSPFKVSGCEIVSFPFFSISNSNMLEGTSPRQSDRYKTHDWVPFKNQSPQGWIDS